MQISQLLRSVTLPSAFLACAPFAAAQSFNLDVGANQSHPLPSSNYAAAANQPGLWFGVGTTAQLPVPLTDIAFNLTGVTITPTGGFGDFAVNNPTWSGDDDLLMEDASDVGGLWQGSTGGSITWTISGLLDGSYEFYTYALAPDFPAAYQTRVTVPGAVEGPQIVGGAWSGSPHVLGVSYAKHTLSVAAGQTVTIITDDPGTSSSNLGTVNGFQIKKLSTGSTFCEPGLAGVMACPCANPPAGSGRGCENSAATGGANLFAAGGASLGSDTLVFTASGEKPTATSVFLQGTTNNLTGIAFGQGVRCVGGVLKRLYIKTASGGVATAPLAGDATVSARSAALGDAILAGQTRYYQTYYRDPIVLGGCPATSTFNASQAREIFWSP